MTNSQLYNNDCLDQFKFIPDNSVDLILTDPPYGINYKSGRQGIDRVKSVKGEGDIKIRKSYFNSIIGDDVLDLTWLKEAYRVLKNNSAMYVFCHWSKWHILYPEVESLGFKVKNMIVLNKSNHGAGDLAGAYASKHELVLYATKGRHELLFPNGRSKDVINASVIFSGNKKLHPNEKPLSWHIPFIENSSKEGDTVLDPFMGSGSCGAAALSLRRKFIGIEKSLEYFKIADNRLSQLNSSEDIF